jgi:hypothetical protein
MFAPGCGECGRLLVRTGSGYRACPRGHGKLIPDQLRTPAQLLDPPEPGGSWFESDGPADPDADRRADGSA